MSLPDLPVGPGFWRGVATDLSDRDRHAVLGLALVVADALDAGELGALRRIADPAGWIRLRLPDGGFVLLHLEEDDIGARVRAERAGGREILDVERKRPMPGER